MTNVIYDDYIQFFNFFMREFYNKINYIANYNDKSDHIIYKRKKSTIIDVFNLSGVIRTIVDIKKLTIVIMILKLITSDMIEIIKY